MKKTNGCCVNSIIVFVLFGIILCNSVAALDLPMHIVTSADQEYFPNLFNFIGSIHRVNFDELGEISIFDLGFTAEQCQILESMEKVHVYPIEQTNPDIFKQFRVRNDFKKIVRGWYSWKPVAIKQALDMFDCIFYLDSSMVVMTPLDKFFNYIRKNGYFVITCHHSIEWMTTKYVAEKLGLYSKDRAWILEPSTNGLSGGIQGLTRVVYNSYVLPMYELSKDIRNFMDDGTTPNGFGTSRHDQTLFSINARLCSLSISPWTGTFDIDGKKVPYCIVPGSGPDINKGDIIVHGDHQSRYNFRSYIRYKQKKDTETT